MFRSSHFTKKGYLPLPVRTGDKYPRLRSWPVREWHGSADGIGFNLVGLCMIDFDLDAEVCADRDFITQLENQISERWPDAPIRMRDGSSRTAYLFRVEDKELHARLSTDKTHIGKVEFKIGRGEFMFCFGTHPDGARLQWITGSKEFPYYDALPVISLEQVESIRSEFNHQFAEAGYETLAKSTDRYGLDDVFDLSWDMEFVCVDGERRTLEELYHPGVDEFVNLTPWRPDSDSLAGHLIRSYRSDGPMVTDFVAGIRHHMPAFPWQGVDIDDYPNEPLRTERQVELEEKKAYYLSLVFDREENRFFPQSRPHVSMVHSAAFHEFDRKTASELAMHVPIVERRVWDPALPQLSVVDSEDTGTVFNTFQLKRHYDTSGNTAAFHSWLNSFIPDPEERFIVMQWMANKVHRPEVRGFSLVLVGPQGSGKGTLWTIIKRLWGPEVVSNIGGIKAIYDATYQDVLYRTLWVLIDEVSIDDMTYRGRSAAQEQLKAFCEPQRSEKILNIKGQAMKRASICATVGISTNNRNAVPFSNVDDRRFGAVHTGPEMTEAQVDKIHRWASDPANIGALWEELKETDITLNMMRAPATQTKADMYEANLSELDALQTFFLAQVEAAGGYYTGRQLARFVETAGLPADKEGVLKQMLRGLHVKRSVRLDGKPTKVFVLDGIRKVDSKKATESVRRIDAMEADAVRSLLTP